jgi:hypothetical protein
VKTKRFSFLNHTGGEGWGKDTIGERKQKEGKERWVERKYKGLAPKEN